MPNILAVLVRDL